MPSQCVAGMVCRGHGVASGRAANGPYPRGTIEMQRPIFKRLGLDLSEFFQGTINVSIAPQAYRILNPEWTFRQVTWTDRHPPEDFSFSRCRLLADSSAYDSLIYYPHPETKRRNFQDASTLEIIAPPVPALKSKDAVEIEYSPSELAVFTPKSR